MITFRRLRWVGHVARTEESRSAYILTGKPTTKRTLRMSRHRWEDNIRVDIKGLVSMRRIGLILLRIGIIEEPLWMRHWTSEFPKPWNLLVKRIYDVYEWFCWSRRTEIKKFTVRFPIQIVFFSYNINIWEINSGLILSEGKIPTYYSYLDG